MQFTPTDVPEGAQLMDKTDAEWFDAWIQSWFSLYRSTNLIMRATRKDSALLSCFEKLSFVGGVRDVELVPDSLQEYIACSADTRRCLKLYQEFVQCGWNPNVINCKHDGEAAD